MTTRTSLRASLRTVLLGSASLCFAAALSVPPVAGTGGIGTALAQSQPGHGQRGSGGQIHGSGMGSSATHGSGGHATIGTAADSGTGSSDVGAGGPPPGVGGGTGNTVTRGHYGGSTGDETGTDTSDRQGPQYLGGSNTRKPAPGTTGGRPVWAKEGIPVVDLGRLSVARAPASVLQHAFTEVTANWTTIGSTVLTLTADGKPTLTMTVAELYSQSAEQFAQIVQTYYASIVRIDSPLENLGLLKDLVTNDKTALGGVTPATNTDLAAIFLGSASDKSIPISDDTVTAMYTILGLPALGADDTATLADKAEAVRAAIEVGHAS